MRGMSLTSEASRASGTTFSMSLNHLALILVCSIPLSGITISCNLRSQADMLSPATSAMHLPFLLFQTSRVLPCLIFVHLFIFESHLSKIFDLKKCKRISLAYIITYFSEKSNQLKMVGVSRLELLTSRSQSARATNCAKPRPSAIILQKSYLAKGIRYN